ncbi:MAG: type II secretion system protein GspN [Desulfocapsaceae bacterium]|jgi:type II secretion system protein N|nr:type II secretion system protein GspN [Desulfocapsaceae bacterium]
MLKKLSRVFIYLFYAVVLTAVLLVVRFPTDTLLAQAERKIEEKIPDYTCEIGTIHYIYPFSVAVEEIALINRNNSSRLPVSSVLVTPDLKHLLTRFEIRLELLGGHMNTGVVLHPDSNRVEFPSLAVSGVNLQNVDFIEQNLSREIDGTLELSGRYSADLGDLNSGEFSGNVRVRDFQMELKRPVLQSKEVVFTELASFAQLKNGLVEIVDGTAMGPFYDGDFSGSIQLKELWRASVLDVSGSISPKQEYIEQDRQVARAVALLYRKYKSSTLPYRLTGNLENPVFAFGAR